MGNSESLNYKRVLVPFSEEQLFQVFKNHDMEKDGILTKAELEQAFNYLGSRADKALHTADFSEEQLFQVFMNHDKDKDGILTKAELKQAFNYLGSRNSGFIADQALHAADANGDGVITWDELRNLVRYYTLS